MSVRSILKEGRGSAAVRIEGEGGLLMEASSSLKVGKGSRCWQP